MPDTFSEGLAQVKTEGGLLLAPTPERHRLPPGPRLPVPHERAEQRRGRALERGVVEVGDEPERALANDVGGGRGVDGGHARRRYAAALAASRPSSVFRGP